MIVDLPVVPAKLELIGVAPEVLLADVLKRANNATFQQRKEGLRRVRVNVAPSVLMFGVRHRLVTALEVLTDAGSGYMLTDESGKSKLLACQTEERQNDPECHHA